MYWGNCEMVIPGHLLAWRPWWGAGPVTRHFPLVHSEPGSHGSVRAACLASGNATSPLMLWSWGPPPPPALEEPQELWVTKQRLKSESFCYMYCWKIVVLNHYFQTPVDGPSRCWSMQCRTRETLNTAPWHLITLSWSILTTGRNDIKKQQTQTHPSVSLPTVPFSQHICTHHPDFPCLLHLFNMSLLCLSAISRKLSVIMTVLYGRPFGVSWTSPFWDGCAINRSLPLKPLPFALPKTLQVPIFPPKSQPHFHHLPQDHAAMLFITKIFSTV